MNINRKKLIRLVAKKTKLTQKDTALTIDATLDTIMDALNAGNAIKLINFGKFISIEHKGRIVKNPRTGEEMELENRIHPKFTPGKKFKDVVSGIGAREEI